MNKAYKYRIYPSNEQTIIMSKTFGCVRFVYNEILTVQQLSLIHISEPTRP